MSITIGRIGDKFGSNSTYKQPNTFPVYDEQQVLERTRPSLTSFISGDIYLKGGNGNHCIYKGGYYALHILRILDADKDLYHYRLERELGFDVLQANTVVIGDLTTSTDPKLLEENIHKTIGILDNPTHITTINFKEIKTDDKTPFDDLTIIESTNSLLQKVVSQQAFEAFLNLRNEINTDWAKLNKEFYGGIRNPAVFIIGKLDEKPLEVVGGKEKIRKEVNKFAKEIREKKKELSLSKVTTPENSRIVGKYCITGKNDPIGQAHEPYIVKEVDLSGLSDIVALVPGTLEPVEPLTPLNVTVPEKGGLFFDPNGKEYSEGFKGKIAKIPYNPFKEAATHNFPNPSYRYYGSKQGAHSHWLGAKDCQNIDGEFEGTKGKARLWGSDNLNGIFKQGTSTDLTTVMIYPGGRGVEVGLDEPEYNEKVLNKGSHVPFSLPGVDPEKQDGSDPFYQVKDERVHFGFLIFQLYKDFNNWDLFEYRGVTGLKKIPYIAGISKSFFRYYSASSREHWANINDDYYKTNKLAKIQPKGSDSFVRAYLDNYWLGWLATLPQTESRGYATNYYQDEYGIYYYRGYYSYTYQQIRSDIRNVKGNSIEPSPLASPEVYKAFRQKKGTNLSTHLLKGLIDLPEDLTIESGDYFFSDVDYALKKYDSLIFPNTEHKDGGSKDLEKKASKISAINEDYVVDINKSQTLKSGTFMCTTKDGKLDVRILYHFDSSLYLSEDANQAVKAVESEKYRNTNFYLLKKGPSFEQGKDLTIIAKSQILKEAYKNLKHPVSDSVQTGSDPLAGWLGYDDQDLKTKQLLFDLKGTDWYCLFHKGKLHLIAKDLTPLGTPDQASQRLDHEENKGYKSVVNSSNPPTLIEKVNQKVQLRFHTASYDLNGKTNFDDSDSLSLSFKPADANSKQYGQEFYFLYLNTKHDVIGWETVSVSKLEHTKTVQLAEGIELERLNLSLLNSHRLYQANQGRFQLAQKRVDENIRRAQRNLEIQKMQADLNFATGILSSAAANTMAMGDSISNIAEFAKGGHGSDRWIDAFQDSYGGSGGTGHEFEYPINIGDKGRNGPQGKAMARMGLSGASRAAGLARTIGNYAIKTGHLFPERQRRINEDKKLAAEKLALMSLQMNTKHMTAQLNAQLEMNRIFSRYDVPAINTRDLNVEFRGNTQIHGKSLKEVHLVVYTPSAEQMKYLEEYVEEFGIGCDIPDAKISLFPGMAGCVLRYRNLEDKGMKNLINVTVREYLKTRLHTGVKVVEIAKADPHHACLNDAQYRAALTEKENKHNEAMDNLKTEHGKEIKAKNEQIEALTKARDKAVNAIDNDGRPFETNVRAALGPEYKNTTKTPAAAIPGVITNLKTELSNTKTQLDAAKKAKTDADEEGKKKLDEAEKDQLTCDQFKKLAGHTHYDLNDQETIKNIEKLAVVLAITVKYSLLFNVDQRFGQDHLFQDVFKDLYEIAENDLVSGFLEAFQAEDGQKATIGAGTSSEWSKPIPEIINHARSEAAREKMVLQYTSETNNGRLFLDTDKDILNASKIVEGDLDYLSGAINISPSTGKPVTYADIKQKAILNITVANLNQLKELLDDFCVSLENATMGHLIDVNTFDTSGRSERCLGVLPNTHCDEVNFIRLCYSGLRFYKRIWPVVDNTDVPYGFVTSGITREADQCQGKVSFGVVKHIKPSTIFPSIGLYAYNAKWPTWAVNGRTIRHGTLNHWLQVFEPFSSTKSYDNIKPVINNTAGIRVYKKGYTKSIGDISHSGLDWSYVMDKYGTKDPGPIKDCYLTINDLILDSYYLARERFFNRAVQMLSAIFNGYMPQAVDIRTTRIRVFKVPRSNNYKVDVDTPSLAEKIYIDEIFGYETYKYALIHLLTMHLFRIRFEALGTTYSDGLNVITLRGQGFKLNQSQSFESWDNSKFTKYVQDQLNRTRVFSVSPDFAEAHDLFRGIHRNLRQWKDPTKDSNLSLLAEELNRVSK